MALRRRFPVLCRALAVASRTAILLLAVYSPGRAEPVGARDALRQALDPLVDILSREPTGPSRALSFHATVTESSAQPPELIGSHLAVYLQPSDQALFQFLSLGCVVTVCRQGQAVWVAPADKLAPLLAQVEAKPPTRADREPIAPVRLKVPPTLFWLLFRLVPVQDAGTADFAGAACRRVDVHPPGSEDKNGYLRVWLRADNGTPVRLDWHGTNGRSTIVIDDLHYTRSLPAQAFDPAAVPPETRLTVPAERFRPLMALLDKLESERRKKLLAGGGGVAGAVSR